jgi:hypothetical protein
MSASDVLAGVLVAATVAVLYLIGRRARTHG